MTVTWVKDRTYSQSITDERLVTLDHGHYRAQLRWKNEQLESISIRDKRTEEHGRDYGLNLYHKGFLLPTHNDITALRDLLTDVLEEAENVPES